MVWLGDRLGDRKVVAFLVGLLLVILAAGQANAEPIGLPKITLGLEEAQEPLDVALSLRILFLLTVLSLAPAILVLMTSFTRIIVFLSLVRNALGTNQTPPNQVLVGLALFLTLFVMAPVFQQINSMALQPYLQEEILFNEALQRTQGVLRDFMLHHTREQDLALFLRFAGSERPATREDVGLHVLIPAYVISELKTAFQLGFAVFIPFIVIDMIVASTLMSMGMFMLPPVMISLPFKILLFVAVDGWHLVIRSLLTSFQ